MRTIVQRGVTSSQLVVLLFSCLASVYVGGRLWITSRETHYLRQEVRQLREAVQSQQELGAGSTPVSESHVPRGGKAPVHVLFHSTRPSPNQPQPLSGPSVDDPPAIQAGDGSLLGQVDDLQAGRVTGWACSRGAASTQTLKVLFYIDGVLAGETQASSPITLPHIRRLCQAGDGEALGAFSTQLPALPMGTHELRAFLVLPGGAAKQELNQSPLTFHESNIEPDAEEQLRRKDAIIQVRNAQVAALWDELHTRQPWRNALDHKKPLAAFEAAGAGGNATRLLAFLGINTGLGARNRRDILRRTWVLQGDRLAALERELGVRIRFVIGGSEQKDDVLEQKVQQEMEEFHDIMRLDMVDTYADLSMKTLKMFAEIPNTVDADFYFKIDDDVGVNVPALAEHLQERRSQGNLYLGCMKSGQVLTESRWKWYEPEHWRYGDPAGNDGRINYPRHASGQLYGLSRPVAQYIGQNAAVLHRFANEDVTLGTWLLGLDIKYEDERRLCCDSEAKCEGQTGVGNVCLGYYEHQCAGTCYSEQRLEPIFHHCLEEPFSKEHREQHPHPDAVARRQHQEQQQKEGGGEASEQQQQQQNEESRRSKMEAMFRAKQAKQA